jgi:HPt (histidine-containing phosphotransfer) domain-containing protein
LWTKARGRAKGKSMQAAKIETPLPAFCAPEAAVAPSGQRPLDLVHLARQTCGDRALEAEVLGLFRQQLNLTIDQFRRTRGRERAIIAHTLKGAARSVGAFPLARVAELAEQSPLDDTLIAPVEAEAARLRDFIAALNR